MNIIITSTSMNFCKSIFLFTLLLLSFYQLYSQEYLFDAKLLTTEDGLANLMTSSVYKDKNGYLWVGTSHLLSFATLKTTLPSEYLIGTDKGLCYLNIQEKQIRPFT